MRCGSSIGRIDKKGVKDGFKSSSELKRKEGMKAEEASVLL